MIEENRMAEPTQYTFEIAEVIEALVKKARYSQGKVDDCL
jgi:hypothetical protein